MEVFRKDLGFFRAKLRTKTYFQFFQKFYLSLLVFLEASNAVSTAVPKNLDKKSRLTKNYFFSEKTYIVHQIVLLDTQKSVLTTLPKTFCRISEIFVTRVWNEKQKAAIFQKTISENFLLET